MRKFSSWLAVILLVATGSVARADFFQFTVANTTFQGGSPYADLTITNIAPKELQFVLTDGPNDSLGNFSELGFNLASGLTINSYSVTENGGNASSWADTLGPGQMDGFGSYDVIIGDTSKNQANRLTSVTIDVTFNQTVTPSDVEYPNYGTAGNPPGQFYFAAKYYDGYGSTGYIGVPSPSAAVPAPPGVALVMSGCGAFGLFYFARRRKTIALT